MEVGPGASAVLVFPASVVSSLSLHRTGVGAEWKLGPRGAPLWFRSPGVGESAGCAGAARGLRAVGRPAGPRADGCAPIPPVGSLGSQYQQAWKGR